MSTKDFVIVNQIGRQAGWHTHRYFRRYHRRFHRAWYWLTGAFLLEIGFWLAMFGLVLSVGLLAALLVGWLKFVTDAWESTK